MSIKLETRQLGKRYGSTVALAPTNLQVRSGEFLTLLGPSGSGKTTVLQMIAGLTEPSEGSIYIDGVDATYLPAGERGIGLVFQSYALFPHLTVADNVAYPLRMRRMSARDAATAAKDALDMVKMAAFGARYPRELSGGQQQRVALARCFVYKPSVILLDEPLGALDKKLREHMQLEIRRLHQDSGATFIYVTHDQDEALAMSDRICLMNDAKIEQIGTPHELYDKPVSRFSADFLGHSNLLDGVVNEGVFEWQGYRLPLPEGQDFAPGKATLLLRPELATLTQAEHAMVRGSVKEMVFTGSDVRVMVNTGADNYFSVRVARAEMPTQGETVGISWNPTETVLLRE